MSGEASPRMLDLELLEQYAEAMRRCGVPFDERSGPGLSADEIEATVEPLGLRLPDEARTWWGWRNGQPDRLYGLYAPGFRAAPLAEAVGEYRLMREVAADTAEPGLPGRETADELWSPNWFPLEVEKSHHVVDCSVAPGEPTSVSLITSQLKTAGPSAHSLGEAVLGWCRSIDSGTIRWDAEQQLWADVSDERP